MPLLSNSSRDERLNYVCNLDPICPHCDAELDVSGTESYELYKRGEHEVTCPSCDRIFLVETEIQYLFSTDKKIVSA